MQPPVEDINGRFQEQSVTKWKVSGYSRGESTGNPGGQLKKKIDILIIIECERRIA